jgi:hypothetical protein
LGNYYQNGKLPGQQKKGSFWWRDIIKLTNLFKGVAIPKVQEGSTILFWQDLWNEQILQQQFPELFSFALNPNATVKAVLNAPNWLRIFISASLGKPISNSLCSKN